MMSDAESIQNGRIRDLENRVNEVENDLSAILAELNTIKTLAKGLLMAVALSLGVDVSPMLGA